MSTYQYLLFSSVTYVLHCSMHFSRLFCASRREPQRKTDQGDIRQKFGQISKIYCQRLKAFLHSHCASTLQLCTSIEYILCLDDMYIILVQVLFMHFILSKGIITQLTRSMHIHSVVSYGFYLCNYVKGSAQRIYIFFSNILYYFIQTFCQ